MDVSAPPPPASIPNDLRQPLRVTVYLYILCLAADIAQVVLVSFSLAGQAVGGKPGRIRIEFPPLPDTLLKLQIAVSALGIVMDLAFAFIVGVVIQWRYATRMDAFHFAKSRRLLYQLNMPWNLLSIGFWAAAVALGSRYAIDLDFAECRLYPGLTQCQTVKATWAMAISLVPIHGVLLLCCLYLIKKLWRPPAGHRVRRSLY